MTEAVEGDATARCRQAHLGGVDGDAAAGEAGALWLRQVDVLHVQRQDLDGATAAAAAADGAGAGAADAAVCCASAAVGNICCCTPAARC